MTIKKKVEDLNVFDINTLKIKTTNCKIKLHNALLFVACLVLARYTIYSIVMNLQLCINRLKIKLH